MSLRLSVVDVHHGTQHRVSSRSILTSLEAEIVARRSGTGPSIRRRSGASAARARSGCCCARRARLRSSRRGRAARAAARRNGSSGRQIGHDGSEPIQYSFLIKSMRLPISEPISSVTAGGRNRAGALVPAVSCTEAALVRIVIDRRPGIGDGCIEPVSAIADQELGLVGQGRPADPDEHPVRALEVGDDPAVQAADHLVSDLDVPGRDPAVERNAQVPLGAADDEPMIANADDLAVGLAVVEDRQNRHRRPHRRPITGLRPALPAAEVAAGSGRGVDLRSAGPGWRPF